MGTGALVGDACQHFDGARWEQPQGYACLATASFSGEKSQTPPAISRQGVASPIGYFTDRAEYLFAPWCINLLAGHARFSGAQDVQLSESKRVNSHFPRHHVDMRFPGEHDLLIAWCAQVTGREAVGIDRQ